MVIHPDRREKSRRPFLDAIWRSEPFRVSGYCPPPRGAVESVSWSGYWQGDSVPSIERANVLEVHDNIDSVKKSVKWWGQKATKTAMFRAMNKAGLTAKKVAKQEIATERNLKSGTVGKRLTMFKARPSRLTVMIKAKGRMINLYEVKGRKTQKALGVSVKTRANESPTLVRGAFIATMPNGKQGIFSRKKDGGKRVKRLPIQAHFLPSVAHTMEKPRIRKAIRSAFLERYEPLLRDQLKHEHGKALARVKGVRLRGTVRIR